jgi:16S rRNA processing protein RimM
VGRVVRPHGLSGEVVVELVSNRPERVEPGSLLHAEGTALRVTSSKPFAKRWLVRFDGVTGLDSAEQLRGRRLFARAISDPDALWVHELIGAQMRTTSGEDLGRVSAVVANPASDLLELEDGGLVPARFVVEHGGGTVVVELPPGLLE